MSRIGALTKVMDWVAKVGAPFREVNCGWVDVRRLKEPSDSPEILDALMRVTCNRYELVSQVEAASLEGGTSSGKPESKQPRGPRNRELDELRTAYRQATCNWDRLKVIGKAQQALERISGGPDLAKRRGTSAWKLAIANDTRASALVGEDFGVSASYVRKLRGELQEP